MAKDAFCDKGILARQAYFETRHFYALYDIAPMLAGASLIIPKRHMLFITELSRPEFLDLQLMIGTLMPKLLKTYKTDAYNFTINANRNAGMCVPHLHIHIIPRRARDGFQHKSIIVCTARGRISPLRSQGSGRSSNINRNERGQKYCNKRQRHRGKRQGPHALVKPLLAVGVARGDV